MYELRELVAKLFIELREEIFEMEIGKLSYELLDKDPCTMIPIQMKDFTRLQQIEVLRCMTQKLDIEPLLRHEFNYRQMSELRLFQQHGLNVDLVCDPRIEAPTMTLVRRKLIKGINVSLVDITQFQYDQLVQIFLCIEQDLDFTQLLNPELTDIEMTHIRNMLAEKRTLGDNTTEKYRAIHEAIFGDKIK